MKHLLTKIALCSGIFLLVVFWGALTPVVRSANWQVTNSADAGSGTLRRAMLNAAPGDTIIFDPSVFPPGSPVTIFVQSALPTLAQDNITLDASNAGAILDGSLTPGGTKGLRLETDNCTIRGLTIQNFPSDGVWIAEEATGNIVGGDRDVGAGPNGQGNLIAFNGFSGVAIRGDGNYVQGNYIGVDGSGWWDWGNGTNGVSIWDGASNNVIGGVVGGHRNVIAGNGQNGVWIGGSGSDQNQVIGNYIGTRADGAGPISNSLSGVAIQGGARDNQVGGTANGTGNLISGNADTGIYISDSGTDDNQVLGNTIGPNKQGNGIIGQGRYGVSVVLGASNNTIGGDSGGRNLIGGNSSQGVLISGSDTMSNTVQSNYIGTDVSGVKALPNGWHGVELADETHGNLVKGNLLSGNAVDGLLVSGGAQHNTASGNLCGSDVTGMAALPNGRHGIELSSGTHDNLVGGNRLSGEGNLLSGNRNHGLIITEDAHHNTVSGNLIGSDTTGTYSLGNQPMGGIDISNGAHHNVIGGLGAGEGNVVSGNQTDGIALFKSAQGDATDNQVLGNLIGLGLDGINPLPNEGWGILNAHGAARTHIEGNTIAFNEKQGILIATCTGNTITQNSIYSNTLAGIENEGNCPSAPKITGIAIGPTETISGTTVPNAQVEFFSDDEDEGRIYEGFTMADAAGSFSFSKVGGFAGPNATATSTDSSGNTSEFSQPAHLLWTLLIYLNGDNDLEALFTNTLTNTIAAGPSPRANVLVLMDGYTTTSAYSGTVLYDVTWGEATELDVAWNITGELNMGDGQTLIDFVTWGRTYYPARHTMLSIVDHGGGWAPSGSEFYTGALARHRHWMAGNSGLSWDFSSDYDYLDSEEIRQALATITNNGADSLDVVFYDVCLMGMVEVAYQIQDYATFFVSSQNIGWAPVGPQSRYIRTIHNIEPSTTTSRQMAELLVDAYSGAMPLDAHPFTISAVDLSLMPTLVDAVDQLAVVISQTLGGPGQVDVLHSTYNATQKLDYDIDFSG